MGRGKSKKTIELIDAAWEILVEIQSASVRAVCYRLFTIGTSASMSKTRTRSARSHLGTRARQAGIGSSTRPAHLSACQPGRTRQNTSTWSRTPTVGTDGPTNPTGWKCGRGDRARGEAPDAAVVGRTDPFGTAQRRAPSARSKIEGCWTVAGCDRSGAPGDAVLATVPAGRTGRTHQAGRDAAGPVGLPGRWRRRRDPGRGVTTGPCAGVAGAVNASRAARRAWGSCHLDGAAYRSRSRGLAAPGARGV